MRHRVSGRLFGRTANQRKALLRGLMASLFEYQRIETTLAKAKEVKKLAERVITLGIKGDLNSKRVALARVPNRAAIAKLFNEIAPRFSGRNGGYLRLVQTRNRVNDAAPMAVLEFVDYEEIRTKKEEPKKEEAKEQKPAQKEQKAAPKEKKAAQKEPKAEGQKPARAGKKKEEKKEGE